MTDLRSARFYAILGTGYVPPHALDRGLSRASARRGRQRPAPRQTRNLRPAPRTPGGDTAALRPRRRRRLAAADGRQRRHRPHPRVSETRAPCRAGRSRAATRPCPSRARPHPRPLHSLAGTLDYFAVGPIFATPTKPDYEPVCLDLVRLVAATRPALPWFCIGGIKRATLPAVLAAGASRVVVVSEVLCAADPAALIRDLRAALGSH